MKPLSEGKRWRCKSCGNLTRFDVVRTIQLEEYHHFTIGGTPAIEEPRVLKETIDRLSCRWCKGTDIEVIEALEVPTPEGTDTAP